MNLSRLYNVLAEHHKELKPKLIKAGMSDSSLDFIRKTFILSSYSTIGILFILFMFFAKSSLGKKLFIFLVLPGIIFFIIFNYFLRYPDMQIKKKEKDINKEIIYAGRFLIIELDSGISLYNAMINLGNNYEHVGKYFREIVERVKMGTTIENAINEGVESVPSSNLQKILWQILNSLKTGSDVSNSLNSVLEQVIREQQIEVKEYGRKLNPLAMFYMMIAVIVPSLGMTMLVVLATFLGLHLSLFVLLSITGLLGFMQFMFIAMVKSSRPAVEI